MTFASYALWPTLHCSSMAKSLTQCVLWYPNAQTTHPITTCIPGGFAHIGTTQHQILDNNYGENLKYPERTFNPFMQEYLIKLGLVKCPSDPCIFFYKQIILMMYVDDVIISGPNEQAVADAINYIKDNIHDFLG